MVSESLVWAPPPPWPRQAPRCVAHGGRGLASPPGPLRGGVGALPCSVPCTLMGPSWFKHLNQVAFQSKRGIALLRRREKGGWVSPWSRQEQRQAFISTAAQSDPWEPERPGGWGGESVRAARGQQAPAGPSPPTSPGRRDR